MWHITVHSVCNRVTCIADHKQCTAVIRDTRTMVFRSTSVYAGDCLVVGMHEEFVAEKRSETEARRFLHVCILAHPVHFLLCERMCSHCTAGNRPVRPECPSACRNTDMRTGDVVPYAQYESTMIYAQMLRASSLLWASQSTSLHMHVSSFHGRSSGSQVLMQACAFAHVQCMLPITSMHNHSWVSLLQYSRINKFWLPSHGVESMTVFIQRTYA